MHAATWVRLTFVAATGLQVATIFLDHRLMPYCGTVAMAALLAMALSSPPPAIRRWTHHAALVGLVVLTVVAYLADRRTSGYGWSSAPRRWPRPCWAASSGCFAGDICLGR